MNSLATWFKHLQRWEVYIEHRKRRTQLFSVLAIVFVGSIIMGSMGGIIYTEQEKQTLVSIAKEIEHSEKTQMDQLVEQLKVSK